MEPKATPAGEPKNKVKAKKKGVVEAPALDYDRAQAFDRRDTRATGPPCSGQHQVKNHANQHAACSVCMRCGLRLQYVPRVGRTGLHRSAGPLVTDVESVLKKVASEEPLEYNPRLRDQTMAIQAAEVSAVKQLEQIRAQKDKLLPPKTTSGMENAGAGASASTAPKSPSSVIHIPDTETMTATPGNKRHQGQSAEEQEYAMRNQTES